jgi:hypothetical protein
MAKIEPKETDELLANPHMGWQTFHHFADDDANLQGLPSGAAYARFYWKALEPREGDIDLAMLDDLLAHARRAGQKLSFRAMCTGSRDYMDSPQWLKDKGCKGFDFHYEGANHWVPDFEDPMFQQAHFRLIAELGKRYDGHPDVDHIDIGSVGLWGEWHMSGTGVELPSVPLRLKIIDAYFDAFPNTLRVMLIGDKPGMSHAISRGAGWRADCLGDMGGFSPCWNHMRDAYPEQIEGAGAADAWQQAPVAWETCWDMRKWVQEGWDVRHIFGYALEYHASYVNNKSAPIPDGFRPEVERLLRKLGYRLVLRSLEHAADAKAGAVLTVRTDWGNVGVAPPYGDYRIAFRLTDVAGKSVTVTTDTSIKGWLPGPHAVSASVTIPRECAKGKCRLAVGIVDPRTNEPATRLAIQGRDPDGWYPLSSFEAK